jgi:hypothetical protein
MTVFVIVLCLSLCCLAMLYLGDLDTTSFGVPWHIEGQVFDNANNNLAGVNITVSTIGSIGGVNSIFGRGPRNESHFKTMSDNKGRFAFDLKAVDVQISFEKAGFTSDRKSFSYIGTACDSTNQNLKIVLKTNPN